MIAKIKDPIYTYIHLIKDPIYTSFPKQFDEQNPERSRPAKLWQQHKLSCFVCEFIPMMDTGFTLSEGSVRYH